MTTPTRPSPYVMRQGVPRQPVVQVASADGTLEAVEGIILITKASAATLGLVNPPIAANDGAEIRIISTTAFAHTITAGSTGFNAGASTTVTLTDAIGASAVLLVYDGEFYLVDPDARTVS